MRIYLSLFAVFFVGSAAFAQTDQEFEMRGIRTSYTDRAGVGRGVGEVLQGFHASHHRGLAENGGLTTPLCSITKFAFSHQDQNAATVENFDMVVRKGDDTNGPITGTAGLYGEVVGLKTPLGTGIQAWRTTIALSASATIKVDCARFLAMGMRFTSPAPNLWADGHGIHTAHGTAGKSDMGSWTEDHIPTAQAPTPNHAWQLPGAVTKATQPPNFSTWRLGFGTQGACLQLGTGGGYGMGGLFPKTSTASAPLAYTARVRLGAAYNGASVVAATSLAGYFPVPIPFGAGASLYINPGSLVLFFGPAANASGESTVQIAPFIPDLNQTVPRFVLPFQAAGQSATTVLKLTNVQVMEPH